MRRLAARHGAGLVVSEMIASGALTTGHRDMVRKMAASPGLPHMVQLAGCEAGWMAEAARMSLSGSPGMTFSLAGELKVTQQTIARTLHLALCRASGPICTALVRLEV